MDLAKSILNEMMALQAKNDELKEIISRLETESDQIISQFENKISELQKLLKTEQEDRVKVERGYETALQEVQKKASNLDSSLSLLHKSTTERITELETLLVSAKETIDREKSQFLDAISVKDRSIVDLEKNIKTLRKGISDQKIVHQRVVSELNDEILRLSRESTAIHKLLEDKITSFELKLKTAETEIKNLKKEHGKIENEYEKQLKHSESTIQNLHKIVDSEKSSRIQEISSRDKQISELSTKLKTIEDSSVIYKKAASDREHKMLLQIEVLTSVGTRKDEEIIRLKTDAERLELNIQEKETVELDLKEMIKELNHEIKDKDDQTSIILKREKKLQEILDLQSQRFQEREEDLQSTFKKAQEYQLLYDQIKDEFNSFKDSSEKINKGLIDDISLFSANNEASRLEIDRFRLRLRAMERAIREDYEEPVQTLFREISNLSYKLALKETEVINLSARLIQLDTENTRISRLLARTPIKEEKESHLDEKTHVLIDNLEHEENLALSKEVADLDDPARAMDAARSLVSQGSKIVSALIPMLFNGSIQQRVWIAVILYEINDPLATNPLKKILEISDAEFRELVWETRRQVQKLFKDS